MGYGWIITKDIIEDGLGNLTSGPRGSQFTFADLEATGTQFRMYDDDGTLYYEGLICGDFDGFEPLDDFGTPNAGATRIELYLKGRWEHV